MGAIADKLKVTYGEFEDKASKMQGQWDIVDGIKGDISKEVGKLTGTDSGFDSDAGREFFNQVTKLCDNIQKSQDLLKDHISDLRIAAEKYKEAEDAVKGEAEKLITSAGEIF